MRTEKHGTIAERMAGCRCEPCKAAWVKYEKRRRHDARTGRDRMIDATGTHRRIRALMVMGWTQGSIARHAGWKNTKNVNDLLKHDQIHRRSAERIHKAYDDLAMLTGPSKTVRTLARNRGYASPLAWDDIDNPDEEQEMPKAPLDVAAEVEQLIDTDTPANLAARLGYTPRALAKNLRRKGRTDLANRFEHAA